MTTDLMLAPNLMLQTLLKPIATPKELIVYHEDMTRIIKEALKDGVDFGVIPGTKKPSLYKAGAERINIAFGTHPEYELVEKEIDHDRVNVFENKYRKDNESFGLYRYVYKCKIVKFDGTVVGEGQGVCSTMENKYISRPRDSENTVCKMSQKRAFLAATLHTFGLSDRFTQDMEDMHHDEPSHAKPSSRPSPVSVPQPVINFNSADPKHLDWLEKKLVEKNVATDKHDAIATAYNGKPFQPAALDDVIEQITLGTPF